MSAGSFSNITSHHPSATASLTPQELSTYVRFVAANLDVTDLESVEFTPDQRWHRRLHRDGVLDLWLIAWLPTQGTQLHDHGGSGGAFTVITGALHEAVYRHATRSLIEFVRHEGTGAQFGSQYIHDVRNLSDAPAVSVHAYSPPLTSMNFYDLDDVCNVELLLTLDTDDPEVTVEVPQRQSPAA